MDNRTGILYDIVEVTTVDWDPAKLFDATEAIYAIPE